MRKWNKWGWKTLYCQLSFTPMKVEKEAEPLSNFSVRVRSTNQRKLTLISRNTEHPCRSDERRWAPSLPSWVLKGGATWTRPILPPFTVIMSSGNEQLPVQTLQANEEPTVSHLINIIRISTETWNLKPRIRDLVLSQGTLCSSQMLRRNLLTVKILQKVDKSLCLHSPSTSTLSTDGEAVAAVAKTPDDPVDNYYKWVLFQKVFYIFFDLFDAQKIAISKTLLILRKLLINLKNE